MDKSADEKILDFINEAEKRNARKDITNGQIKIGNIFYEFCESSFFEDKFKMYIPNNFEDMDEESRKFKFPSENRPKIIKCNEDGSICITLNIVESPLSEKKVSELKDGLKLIIKKTNPANVFYEDGVMEVNDKNIGFFEFKSSAIDDFIYNLMFVLEFEKKTLMGTFSCRYGEYNEWRDIAFQMIKTIKVIKEEEEVK